MVKTGQQWSGLVVTKDSTGALATPSVGPVGALYVDGVSNGAGVTITGSNPYKWTVTLPALTAGQCVSMYITATIATIATASVVAEDVADTVALSDVNTALAAVAKTGADGDTLETLSDQLDAIDVNGTAAAVWAYTPRTLTQTAAAVASVMAGTSLTITRGDTLSATLTGLGNITGYANLWFTVKWATSDLDAAAIIQIDTDTGLLTVNGAAATAGNGSITVDDATAGDITIALEASVTDDLTPATGLVYDVQWQSGTSIYTLTSGVAVVSADVTRAVA